jgi:hypothetical protein
MVVLVSSLAHFSSCLRNRTMQKMKMMRFKLSMINGKRKDRKEVGRIETSAPNTLDTLPPRVPQR